jgi:hypothetical protein
MKPYYVASKHSPLLSRLCVPWEILAVRNSVR